MKLFLQTVFGVAQVYVGIGWIGWIDGFLGSGTTIGIVGGVLICINGLAQLYTVWRKLHKRKVIKGS